MCMQCMAGASVAVGSASGMRAWLAMRGWAWLTPKVMRRITIGLMSAAVLASSVLVPGAAPTQPANGSRPAAERPAVAAQGADAASVEGIRPR